MDSGIFLLWCQLILPCILLEWSLSSENSLTWWITFNFTLWEKTDKKTGKYFQWKTYINKIRRKINADSHHTKPHKQLENNEDHRWCRKQMNYPFLLESRHTPAVTQISGENESVNSHVVGLKLIWGQAPLAGVSCFVFQGLLLPKPSLTSALVQPCSHGDYGAHFWDWQWEVMAGRGW